MDGVLVRIHQEPGREKANRAVGAVLVAGA